MQLGFLVSTKHGGYATLDHHLFSNWDGMRYFFMNRYTLGTKYLGYPKCCALANTYAGSMSKKLFYWRTIYYFYFFYEIVKGKKSKADFEGYLSSRSFLSHSPHDFGCEESFRLAQKYKQVFNKYSTFISDVPAQRVIVEKGVIAQQLNPRQIKLIRTDLKSPLKVINNIKASGIIKIVKVNETDFFESVQELFDSLETVRIVLLTAEKLLS